MSPRRSWPGANKKSPRGLAYPRAWSSPMESEGLHTEFRQRSPDKTSATGVTVGQDSRKLRSPPPNLPPLAMLRLIVANKSQ